jgi:hypothetical protein
MPAWRFRLLQQLNSGGTLLSTLPLIFISGLGGEWSRLLLSDQGKRAEELRNDLVNHHRKNKINGSTNTADAKAYAFGLAA